MKKQMRSGDSTPSRYPVAITVLLLFFITSSAVWSVEQVKVMALFSDKAMLQIDGQNRLLKAGESSPEGVRLIAADPHRAIIEVDGVEDSYPLGSSVQSAYKKREIQEVKIWRDTQGSYNTIGTINGQNVDMVVDTGATSVAMSERQSRRLGLQYRLNGEKTLVQTASGIAKAYALMFDKVQVGEITLTNVQGVVIQGNSPTRVLLGMSFLGRVELQNQGDMLILRSKF